MNDFDKAWKEYVEALEAYADGGGFWSKLMWTPHSFRSFMEFRRVGKLELYED